jgi:hypothetical protein
MQWLLLRNTNKDLSIYLFNYLSIHTMRTVTSTDVCNVVALPSANCGPHKVGETFVLSDKPCISCQCLANRLYSDATNSFVTCEQRSCPPVDCSNPVKRADQCCPICSNAPPCNGIKITDCPSSPVELALSSTSSQVVDDYEPKVEDCERLSRNYIVKRQPACNLFSTGTYTVVVTVVIENSAGREQFTDRCQYQLRVVG